MEKINFNKLLLKTAFSCMACDGDIDEREVELIKSLHKNNKTFGDIDINVELNKLTGLINAEGNNFFKLFFKELNTFELSENNQLTLIDVAISTIKADNVIEYSEIKFFKVIRSKLPIDNDSILKVYPDFEEYLEEDIISESYLSKLQYDFFENTDLPSFELIKDVDKNALDEILNQNESD
ncbi:hypothetical protein [Lacinutrix undariae]